MASTGQCGTRSYRGIREVWSCNDPGRITRGVFSGIRAAYQRSRRGHPNFEYWFASGPYRGAADIERRFGIGLGQVGKYFDWCEAHPGEVVWVADDGTPGIELEFDIELGVNEDSRCAEGEHVADCECRIGVPVRGFIDLVNVVGDQIQVRDHKMGNQPGDDFQLAVYALALAETYGIDQPKLGDYWMGKSGKATYPYDLTEWTKEAITERFVELDDNVKNERFDPKPSESVCGFCPVRTSCDFAV